MSGIGSSGIGPGVNPYAGNVGSTKGSDAARGDSTDRSTAAERSTFSQNLNGAGEAERSDDRDADAFFTASGNGRDSGKDAEEQSEQQGHDPSKSSTAGPASIDQPLDDHRGNLINFDA